MQKISVKPCTSTSPEKENSVLMIYTQPCVKIKDSFLDKPASIF